MAKQEVNFTKEKDTKNTVRYTEVLEVGKPNVVGTLYVQKWFAGSANRIKVTIETVE